MPGPGGPPCSCPLSTGAADGRTPAWKGRATHPAPSSLVIFSALLRRQSGSLHPEPHRKRNLVQALEAAGFRNERSRNDAEEHLRSCERPRVDVFREVRI